MVILIGYGIGSWLVFKHGLKVPPMALALIELENPIPFEGTIIRGLRYTTLKKLIEANTTEGLW